MIGKVMGRFNKGLDCVDKTVDLVERGKLLLIDQRLKCLEHVVELLRHRLESLA